MRLRDVNKHTHHRLESVNLIEKVFGFKGLRAKSDRLRCLHEDNSGPLRLHNIFIFKFYFNFTL